MCDVGCLMSSVSMALNQKGITIGGAASNPGVLNAWLRANNGYDSHNDLQEVIVPNINPARISWPADGMHTTNDLPYDTIVSYLKAGRIISPRTCRGTCVVVLVLVVTWVVLVPM